MPPKRSADGFVVPALPKRFRSGSAMPISAASRETSPAMLRPRSSSVNRAHQTDEKRMVTEENWKYGRNKFGVENTHLIVFEPENHVFARVYSLHNKVYWRCMGCRRMDNKATRAEFINGTLYVPLTGFHRCRPKKYEEIEQDQAKLEQRFANASLNDESMDDEEADELPKDQIDTVQFNHPSSEWLRDKAAALGAQYTTAAYQLWGKCNIDQVTSASLPGELEGGTTTSVYECLSKLLTGEKVSAGKIEKAWARNFSSKYKILQKFKNHDFSKMSRDNKVLEEVIFADEATDFHLEFLARFFQCRIGVFERNRWTRYGNWSSSDQLAITMLFKKEQQSYQIILTLD